MSDLEFRIEGDQANEIADELAELLENEFAQRPKKTTPDGSPTTAAQRSDWVGIVALILAIPSAVIATADAVERFKVKEKAEKLIEFAKNKYQTTGVRIWFKKSQDSVSAALDEATASDLLESAEKKE